MSPKKAGIKERRKSFKERQMIYDLLRRGGLDVRFVETWHATSLQYPTKKKRPPIIGRRFSYLIK